MIFSGSANTIVKSCSVKILTGITNHRYTSNTRRSICAANLINLNMMAEHRFQGHQAAPLRKKFTDEAVKSSLLSQILWAAQGITRVNEYHQFRAAPSAGGLFPIETYLAINRVDNIEPGVYHYQVPYHNLVLLKSGHFGAELAKAALSQKMIRDAAFSLVWTAIVERSKWKYDQRAYRYIYLDAGHIGQNAALTAVACGLGSCQVGAFFDDEVNAIIEVDGISETAIYMTAIGSVG
jgi:SagB-type dehydrogenase family enzyme